MDIEVYLKIASNKSSVLEYLLNKRNIGKHTRYTVISLAIYYAIKKLYTGFFGPLAHIPGPFLTRFIFKQSIKYNLLNGKRYIYLRALHEKYGSIVRVSPTIISIADKNIVKKILVTEDLPKAPLYDIISGGNSVSMFTTRDKHFHKQRKRAVSPAFSIKYLSFLETYMVAVANSLIEQISKDIEETKDVEGYGIVDMWSLMQRYALDVIGETAFGQTFDMLENESHFVPPAIKKELKMKVFAGLFPFLAKFFIPGSSQAHPYIHPFIQNVIETRVANGNSSRRSDILQAFIDSQNAVNLEDRLADEAIIAETGLLLSAGTETTGSTLGFAIVELAKSPDKLKKLYKEIDGIPLEEGQKVFKHDQLKNLPYLNAVLKETMRLNPAIAFGLPRITTEEIMLNGQYSLPKGITVVANHPVVQRSSEYWEDPCKFIPERWIPGEDSNVKMADLDAFFPFSAGSRVCIGKGFSLQEMRLVLSSFLKNYEMVPIEQELKNAEDKRVYLTLMLKSNSFKVKVKQREY